MIKPSLRPVSTIQWKIFLSNQVNFMIDQKYFPQKLKVGHISPHIVRCCYNIYIYICKPSKPVQWYFSNLQCKMNESQPLDWLRGVWLMAGLQNRLPYKRANKKLSAAQLGSEHDNMNKKRRPPSTGQKRKMSTLAESNYFYTEKSVMLFMCMLCAWS